MSNQRPLPFNGTAQGNSYDCCHRFYGAPEYPMLIDPDETLHRVVDKYRFADTTEILANTFIVDKEVGVGGGILRAVIVPNYVKTADTYYSPGKGWSHPSVLTLVLVLTNIVRIAHYCNQALGKPLYLAEEARTGR